MQCRTMSNMNERYRLLYNSAQVNQRIGELARAIVTNGRHDNPLFVGLLRGAAPFASKLMFEITRQEPDFHPELDYMVVSTYGAGRIANEPRIVTDLSPKTIVYGREVIVVDDVLDRGLTSAFVCKHIKGLGAIGVSLAVLVDKQTERLADIEADYWCFSANDEWLVGMGMDDAQAGHESYRWLEEIWEVCRDDTPPQLALLSQ